MSLDQEFAAGVDTFFAAAGRPAQIYPRAGGSLDVIAVERPAQRETDGFGVAIGLAPARQPAALRLDVRQSEVALPAVGDRVAFRDALHEVLRAELRSRGLVWRLDLGPAVAS